LPRKPSKDQIYHEMLSLTYVDVFVSLMTSFAPLKSKPFIGTFFLVDFRLEGV